MLEDKPAVSGKRIYARLFSYVWPYRSGFILAIIGNLLYGLVSAVLIKLLEPLLDQAFSARNQSFIKWAPFLVVGIFVVRGIASFLSTFFMNWVARHVVMDFRQKMFDHLLHLPVMYYDQTASGEVLSKLIYNVEQVAEASSEALTVFVREICTAVGLLLVMISISWRLTFFFIFAAPLMASIIRFASKRMRMVSKRTQSSMGGVTQAAQEAIEAQKVIKSFGGHHYETTQFEKMTQHNRRQEMKLVGMGAGSVPIVQLIGSFALAGTIYLATLNPEHILQTAITPGAFAAMISAMVALLKPIKELTKVNGSIQKGIAAAGSIFDFLDEPGEIDEGKRSLPVAQGNIVFEEVNFAYPGKSPVLHHLNFSVKAGETIAIVGRSGSGKSTLASLLPRFYEAQGKILIDGVLIQDIPLVQLRQHISIVSQQVVLFNQTIAYNIAYGHPQSVSSEEIRAAAQAAYAMEFIERLPQGLDTWVGENGVRLSGGQRQRIAIARAILKRAPILILDEATSALDTEAERQIQSVLEKMMFQCTTLVIAHRLSTIENANRIIVLDKGYIVEMGTHAELMQQKGLYATLRTLQYEASPLQTVTV